ncbi:hypothetical protein H0I23_15700 [Cellulophaga sp. HaHaR_3_176]|uniref:hypothetical protein n=1 Tax=Cellulophaga sp. HaHaR_3_176 TaxID=1942464 RepID=UPI001C1FA434|nr:hypothetical protein [Cellulophaga sp. HaHaR_3_176]QWX83874.1 hypothetical protein H0I23_15700 [Cellulophaga sp. HaHaR_3_176]
MSIIKSLDESTTKAAQSGENYVNSTKKYFELKAFQMLTLMSSYIVKAAILGSLSVLGLIFMAISGAIALGEYYDNKALGHLIVGSIIFIAIVLIFLLRKYLDKYIIKKLSKTYFD